MTLHRGTTTLAVLGLLAGFVNVDAFRLNPIPSAGLSSAASSTQRTSAVCKHGKASSAWRTAHRGLSMSTLSALDDFSATDEVDETPPQTNVMDELDAILGDVKTVSKSTQAIWNVHDKVDVCARIASSIVAEMFVSLSYGLVCVVLWVVRCVGPFRLEFACSRSPRARHACPACPIAPPLRLRCGSGSSRGRVFFRFCVKFRCPRQHPTMILSINSRGSTEAVRSHVPALVWRLRDAQSCHREHSVHPGRGSNHRVPLSLLAVASRGPGKKSEKPGSAIYLPSHVCDNMCQMTPYSIATITSRFN